MEPSPVMCNEISIIAKFSLSFTILYPFLTLFFFYCCCLFDFRQRIVKKGSVNQDESVNEEESSSQEISTEESDHEENLNEENEKGAKFSLITLFLLFSTVQLIIKMPCYILT